MYRRGRRDEVSGLHRANEKFKKSVTPDKLKSTDQLKPEHITVFRYAKILRGCVVASGPFFHQRGNNTPPKDFSVPKNCNVLWFQFLSVDFNLSGVTEICQISEP